MRTSPAFDDFHNMLDDFFNDNVRSSRNLLRDTFKIDIIDTEKEYLIEAELPGIGKDEIALNIDDESLCVAIERSKETGGEGKSYIHRERRAASMSRRVRLAGARLADVKAKLDDGILTITVPKEELASSPRKIDIQ